MRLKAKIDGNHKAVVDALRGAGCGVLSLAAVGKGCPDLLVCGPLWPHAMILLEVKDGSKPPSARKLTPDQEKFHIGWRGPIRVVTTPAEALHAMGVWP